MNYRNLLIGILGVSCIYAPRALALDPGFADAIGQGLSADLQAQGGLGLNQGNASPFEKPRLINGDREVVVYAPMKQSQQAILVDQEQQGLAAGSSDNNGNDVRSTNFQQTFGAGGVLTVGHGSGAQMDSRGNGYLDGGVSGNVFNKSQHLIYAQIHTGRVGPEIIRAEGQVEIGGRNVWNYSNDISGEQTIPGQTLFDGVIFEVQTDVIVYGVPIHLQGSVNGTVGFNDGTVSIYTDGGAFPPVTRTFYKFSPYAGTSLSFWGGIGDPDLLGGGAGGNVIIYNGAFTLSARANSDAGADPNGGLRGANLVCMDTELSAGHYLDGNIYGNFVQTFPGADEAKAAAESLCNNLSNIDPSTIMSNVNHAIAAVGNEVGSIGADFARSTNTIVQEGSKILSGVPGLSLADPRDIRATCDDIVATVARTTLLHYQYTLFKWPGFSTAGRHVAEYCNNPHSDSLPQPNPDPYPAPLPDPYPAPLPDPQPVGPWPVPAPMPAPAPAPAPIPSRPPPVITTKNIAFHNLTGWPITSLALYPDGQTETASSFIFSLSIPHPMPPNATYYQMVDLARGCVWRYSAGLHPRGRLAFGNGVVNLCVNNNVDLRVSR